MGRNRWYFIIFLKKFVGKNSTLEKKIFFGDEVYGFYGQFSICSISLVGVMRIIISGDVIIYYSLLLLLLSHIKLRNLRWSPLKKPQTRVSTPTQNFKISSESYVCSFSFFVVRSSHCNFYFGIQIMRLWRDTSKT